MFDHAAALDSEDELPSEPLHVARFSSGAARQAVIDVSYDFVRPLLPKPQTGGGFKDPELLGMLMPTPVTLALPRAERLADLIRPDGLGRAFDGEGALVLCIGGRRRRNCDLPAHRHTPPRARARRCPRRGRSVGRSTCSSSESCCSELLRALQGDDSAA